METYRAFGLTIQSEMALPYLRPARPGKPDLEIGWGPVEEKGLDNPVRIGRFAQAGPDRIWLQVPGVARFLVTGGNRIRVDPEAGADEPSILLYLLGSCLGAIMHQRGQLILHGNALRFGDQCVVFAGNSGAGKSTLAAAFNMRGHEILSDDLAVIDSLGRVQPGLPHIKLWADTLEKLGIDAGGLARIRPQVDKYAYRVGRNFCETPLPLAAVFILHTHNREDVLFEPVHGMGKLAPLGNHTYRPNHIKGLGMQAPHLRLCSRLANQIRLTHITRPMAGFKLDEMVERILGELLPDLVPARAGSETAEASTAPDPCLSRSV